MLKSMCGVAVAAILAPIGAGAESLALDEARGARALTAAEVESLIERVIQNQRRNDAAVDQYERLERKSSGERKCKTYRVVPAGAKPRQLLIEKDGEPVDPDRYVDDLRDLESALAEYVSRGAAPADQEDISYRNSGLLNELPEAFQFAYAGRDASPEGRPQLVFDLTPRPDYVPRGRIGRALPHVRARIWIDERDEQFARIEADIVESINIGGGLLGKVDRGGRIELEQAPVGDGVWLVKRSSLDIEGRKLVFGFSKRKQVEIVGWRRLGPPAEVLSRIRAELDELGSGGRPKGVALVSDLIQRGR